MSSIYVEDRASELLTELRKIVRYEYDDNLYLVGYLEQLESGLGAYMEDK